jgi:4'-phosphopantetheinyl transferase
LWWASIADAHPDLTRHLDDYELERGERLRRTGARARHLLGAVIMRALMAAALDRPPHAVHIRRVCGACGGPHGRPVVEGFSLSVSHSADRVVVAASRTGSIGVDVEHVVQSKTVDLLSSRTLSASELAELDRVGPELRAWAFTRYWTRKEALLKATGQGLTVPLRSVVVTAPFDRADVVRWNGRPARAEQTWLCSLDVGTDYAAAIAAIGTRSLRVEQFDASSLLQAARGG